MALIERATEGGKRKYLPLNSWSSRHSDMDPIFYPLMYAILVLRTDVVFSGPPANLKTTVFTSKMNTHLHLPTPTNFKPHRNPPLLTSRP